MKSAFSKIIALSACAALMACTQASPPPTSAQIESAGMLAQGAHQTAAIEQLTTWAKQGLPVAQRELALTYLNWPEHDADARNWMQSAAKGGDADAQFLLAEALYKGTSGFPADHAQAWAWYEKAALQNNGKASFMLARMAKYGDGTAQSLQESIRWLQASSEQGNAQAMFLLSNAYSSGEGVAKDEVKAREWLEKSAAGDYPVAIQALAMSLDSRDPGNAEQSAANATRARLLLKEANDERLMHWKGYQ
ncbi:MAG: sel1 repeat family protein [Burkholderiaceae bacterium]|nr:sel1 repeat family protein [Burkholderiaceae bacterium]